MVKEGLIELIDKYLSGTASASEKELVDEYLTRLEANANITLDNTEEQTLKEEMWRQIEVQTIHQNAQVLQMDSYRTRWGRVIAVAASIILVIGLGVLFYNNNKREEQSIAVQNNKRIDSSTLFTTYREVNSTGKNKRIQLSDGSLIVLANQSEVTYRQPFIDSRDIILTGTAWFKVAKDKTKPFSVFTGDISTTAVGTEFSVTAFRNEKQIIVRLFEGKVMIKALDKKNNKLNNDVYLLPGQSFVYDGKNKAIVKTFNLRDSHVSEDVTNEEIVHDSPSLPQTTEGSWFLFNNQPLNVVFDELQNIYDVEISYSKKDISNKYFIGKFLRGDSIETILKKIALINNLRVIKINEKYIITK